MIIFDNIIDNALIKGISSLRTDFREGNSEVAYSFDVFCTDGRIIITSDVYSAGDRDKEAREIWLHKFQEAKLAIAKHLGEALEARTAMISVVEDIFNSFNNSLDRALQLLTPDGVAMPEEININLDRARHQAKRLKDYAIA